MLARRRTTKVFFKNPTNLSWKFSCGSRRISKNFTLSLIQKLSQDVLVACAKGLNCNGYVRKSNSCCPQQDWWAAAAAGSCCPICCTRRQSLSSPALLTGESFLPLLLNENLHRWTHFFMEEIWVEYRNKGDHLQGSGLFQVSSWGRC